MVCEDGMKRVMKRHRYFYMGVTVKGVDCWVDERMKSMVRVDGLDM